MSVQAWNPRTRWREVDDCRRGVVLAWVAFTVTFLIARLVTGVLRLAGEGAGGVDIGGVHLHHFLWGILLVLGVAGFGLTDHGPRARSWMGVLLGVGMALIVDEIALLVSLRDVYWQKAGWTSVAVGVLLIGVAGTAIAATRTSRCEHARKQSDGAPAAAVAEPAAA